jgi:lipoprotein signal peptidase
MEIMRRTPIPWSKDVDLVITGVYPNFIIASRTVLHSIPFQLLQTPGLLQHDEIIEQYRLMKLKRMLCTYGVKSFNIADMLLARGVSCLLFEHILVMIRYI